MASDAASSPGNSPTAPKQRTFLGHPIGLYVLFFTEMWERFSYYGMRALLILYMVNYFRWEQREASTIYKVYTSFVYVTPILGGYLADRYLGNKKAVIIGALLMAIGHFLMAFEEFPIFMAALIFLIFGNGFFKPNMSTQVGRLYPASDGRRDGAYTIFYMGINLGAFLSPLVCGWLADNTVGGFHSGFTMAGIGMVLGLIIYLVGQPWIVELQHNDEPAPHKHPDEPTEAIPAHEGIKGEPQEEALSEAQAAATPSVLGSYSNLVPGVLLGLGVVMLLGSPAWWLVKEDIWDIIMLAICGGCLLLVGYICKEVQGGVRDRVLAILILGLFVMFFWAAFEQAGNALNLWADQSTNRYLTTDPPEIQIVPEVIEDKAVGGAKAEPIPQQGVVQRLTGMFVNMVTLKERDGDDAPKTWGEAFTSWFNPVPTTWFQSINALAIFLIAPIFAWLWIYLDRKKMQPSIPMKMALGLALMSAGMAVMMGAANAENQSSQVQLKADALPSGIQVTDDGKLYQDRGEEQGPKLFHGGRLTKTNGSLMINGVLTENERDRLIEQTAPEEFRKKIEKLREESSKIDGDKVKSVEVTLDNIPPGFDMKYAGIKRSILQYKADSKKLVAYKSLADKEVKGLLVAGADPDFRDSIHQLFIRSTTFRVSSWWLFWSYILATLGELCLSPVGLSMVSKLAPAKFATMLMGVWMLTSAFGNFAAGALGEVWGTIPPFQFFLIATAVVGGAAVVLFLLVKWMVKTMHGVN